MKKLKKYLGVVALGLALMSSVPASAQFMPVVYDHTYGKESSFDIVNADFTNGAVVASGVSDGRAAFTWIGRTGENLVFKKFSRNEFSKITTLQPVSDDRVLIAGIRGVGEKDRGKAAGHALLINVQGIIERDVMIGNAETEITSGALLPNGYMILAGHTAKNGQRVGFVCKVSPQNRIVYFYTAVTGETCVHFDVLGNRSEYLHAAFSSKKGGSSVVRLDERGKPYFIATLPDDSYRVERMVSTTDGDIYIVGAGAVVGGTVIKIRPEGDIVFNKPIVPVSSGSSLNHLTVFPTGELLVGGHDLKNAYYALLRSDGTELTSNADVGKVQAITRSASGDDCMVSLWNERSNKGKIIKLSRQGRKLYEKNTAAGYSSLQVNGNSDLLMAAPETGRLSMLSSMGELLFDRFVVENTPTKFNKAYLASTGEAFFVGEGCRMAKLAHGIYVSDITVNKPIDGYTTATFTVTLSGYSFTRGGAPRPVTVDYKTTPLSAREALNFTPVSGTLSFIPTTDATGRYLNKFEVEVPIMANDYLEGDRTFDLVLSNVKDSYLIRGTSRATILDQPAVVRMISSTAGVEGSSDVVYELGIFKTNGVQLTNATRADIVIDGQYGKGSADGLDFDMGRQPRLVIAPDRHSGVFHVQTLEDTRFENIKTVVVDFNKIYAMSDTEVSFGSNILSCSGQIYDQPAMVAIESLGDYNKMNNVVSGFFKISLLRAKDGALQTNCSGGDILLQVENDSKATAKMGTDFVFTNAHDLRIWGDERSSAVNLNGMVLYTPDSIVKTVGVKLLGAKAAAGCPKITVVPNKQSAGFRINNK